VLKRKYSRTLAIQLVVRCFLVCEGVHWYEIFVFFDVVFVLLCLFLLSLLCLVFFADVGWRWSYGFVVVWVGFGIKRGGFVRCSCWLGRDLNCEGWVSYV